MITSSITAFKKRLDMLSNFQPHQVALKGTSRSIEYSHLPQAIASWESRLDILGAKRVACNLENDITWALLDLALLTSKRTAIPVPGFFSQNQVNHLLTTSGCEVYFTATSDEIFGELIMNGEDWHAWLLPVPPSISIPEATAKITYTSGSTGTPKGVCHSANTLLNTANALYKSSGY